MQMLSILFFLMVLVASVTLMVAMVRTNIVQIGAALSGASYGKARVLEEMDTGSASAHPGIVAFRPRAARPIVQSPLPLAA